MTLILNPDARRRLTRGDGVGDDQRLEVLPDLERIEGLELSDPLTLLTPEDLKKLREDLEDMARVRRQAEADSAALRLG